MINTATESSLPMRSCTTTFDLGVVASTLVSASMGIREYGWSN